VVAKGGKESKSETAPIAKLLATSVVAQPCAHDGKKPTKEGDIRRKIIQRKKTLNEKPPSGDGRTKSPTSHRRESGVRADIGTKGKKET